MPISNKVATDDLPHKAEELPAHLVKAMDVNDLRLDPQNPRMAEFEGIAKLSEDEHIKLLWQHMAVDEVAMSIATDGFWDYEPLLAVMEKGQCVVVEGNRRLAAVKAFFKPKLAQALGLSQLVRVEPNVLKSLKKLPVCIFDNRKVLWRHVGFKHLNGPAKWRSFAKAEYIARVHNEYKTPLDEIARQIGDRNKTVQRLFRALMVLQQAEKSGAYNREWSFRGRIAFSHLMTALDYDGYAKFLKIAEASAERREPVGNIKNLGELCLWLWGDKRGNIQPVIQSQNPDLRNLEQVLKNESSIACLRRGEPLSIAFETSKGDERVFREALQKTKASLMSAQARVTSGYDGNEGDLKLSEKILEMATDLEESMKRRQRDLTKKSHHE